MVRFNLVEPYKLTDEHLYAENVELDMLLTFINKHPNGKIPPTYRLGTGHMSFFRDKKDLVIIRKHLVQLEILWRKDSLDKKLPEIFLQHEYRKLLRKYNITLENFQDNINRITDRLKKPLKKINSWHYNNSEISDINEYISIMFG